MKFFTGFLFISALAAIATAQTGGFGPNDGQYKDTSGGPREKIQAGKTVFTYFDYLMYNEFRSSYSNQTHCGDEVGGHSL